MSNLEGDKQKMEETRRKLVSEIALLSNDEFNKRVDPNNWSTAQVCHHLVLTEKAFAKVIVLGLKSNDSNNTEHKNVNFILDRTKRIKAPEIVEPSSEPFEVQQILDLLTDSRNKFLAVLSTIKDKSVLAEKSFKHPNFGELTLDQWVELLYLHEQRHMEQIKEIKLLIGVSK